MHYQHRFHAGNFADVFKHTVVCALLRALNAKPAPWAYLESHAGAGVYSLADEAATRTQEYQDGIGRLLGAGSLPPALADYVDLVRAATPEGSARRYPGSPWFALQLARSDDRLVLCERVPEVAAQLQQTLGADRRVAIHRRDGHELPALLPPAQKRGLILIDPPFERPDEFDALAALLLRAQSRFAAGVYAVWYPYKKRFETERWLRRMQRDLQREALNLVLETGAPSQGQMHACGMLLINPPYAATQALEPALPSFAHYLAQGAQARAWAERWTLTA